MLGMEPRRWIRSETGVAIDRLLTVLVEIVAW